MINMLRNHQMHPINIFFHKLQAISLTIKQQDAYLEMNFSHPTLHVEQQVRNLQFFTSVTDLSLSLGLELPFYPSKFKLASEVECACQVRDNFFHIHVIFLVKLHGLAKRIYQIPRVTCSALFQSFHSSCPLTYMQPVNTTTSHHSWPVWCFVREVKVKSYISVSVA